MIKFVKMRQTKTAKLSNQNLNGKFGCTVRHKIIFFFARRLFGGICCYPIMMYFSLIFIFIFIMQSASAPTARQTYSRLESRLAKCGAEMPRQILMYKFCNTCCVYLLLW